MLMVILFSTSLCCGLMLNAFLALMTIKLKRVKEQEKQDVRRHLDVLYAAHAFIDMVGSSLCYSTLVVIYKCKGMMNEKACTALGIFAAFYITTVAVLTSTINLHIIYSCIKPLKFYVYLKTRTTRIPYYCICGSLVFGVISFIITACGFPRFSPVKNQSSSLYSLGCKLDQQSPVLYYYAIIMAQAVGVGFVTIVSLVYTAIKRSRKWPAKTGQQCCGCAALPEGVAFKIAYALLFLLSWTPSVVVMTTMISGHNVSHDVILSSCYAMIIPSLLSAIVSYVARKELREICKQQLSKLQDRIRCKGPDHRQGLTICNEAAVKNKN